MLKLRNFACRDTGWINEWYHLQGFTYLSSFRNLWVSGWLAAQSCLCHSGKSLLAVQHILAK